MADTRARGGSRRHDPDLIRRLLVEHRTTGASYAKLAKRSGVPVGTLAWWVHRERQAGSQSAPRFVEVRVKADPPTTDKRPVGFTVDVEPGTQVRRITVAAGFDAGELQRLVAALEATC